MLKYLIIFFAAMCLILFTVMGIDKRLAMSDRRRISEKALFILAALGGALGGFIGIYVFRHKTKHLYFPIGFAALFIVQVAAVILAEIYLF